MGLLSELLDGAKEGASPSELLGSLRRREPGEPRKEPGPESPESALEWYRGLTDEERASVRWGTSWKPGKEVPTGFKHGM